MVPNIPHTPALCHQMPENSEAQLNTAKESMFVAQPSASEEALRQESVGC